MCLCQSGVLESSEYVDSGGWGVLNGPRLVILISFLVPIGRLDCVNCARKVLVVPISVWRYWQY